VRKSEFSLIEAALVNVQSGFALKARQVDLKAGTIRLPPDQKKPEEARRRMIKALRCNNRRSLS
jgi:hypothetical protein